jgi:primase-like protein
MTTIDNPPIKPIETHYAGYRFRSRLEARFAVILDAKGLHWEYEPEGFETPWGRYLPDFRVELTPGASCWLEIKPEVYTVTAEDMGRWHSLTRSSGALLVVACGLDTMTIVIAPGHTYSHRGHPGYFTDDDIDAGRAARFEHGEHGTPRQPALALNPTTLTRFLYATVLGGLDLTTDDGRIQALRRAAPIIAHELGMDPAAVADTVETARTTP